MADQDGHHLDIVTQLIRHVTLSPHMQTSKEKFSDIHTCAIYPPSVVVIALIFSELRGPPVVEDQTRSV